MKYAESHEWISLEGDIGTVGVSEYAQSELGDIVYVELPQVGKSLKQGEEVAVLESTKAAADVYTPVGGEIVAVNDKLSSESDLINRAAEGEGWIYKIRLS
ncbi:MAG: glycine cleavage system protein GcvH, partial [Chlamydiia bacterium]|nr:glycine cleavage system protein GcvH [Chlamydiia bacterium]